MNHTGGLEQFGPRLHPALRAAIDRWSGDHPLRHLRDGLHGHSSLKSFLDTCAEAVVARHLLRRDCQLETEVPTPAGKACDFAVRHHGRRFFLHVKRLDTDRPARRRLTISSRLRYLERIDRPYVVSVRWHERATDEQMQRLVKEATAFILRARVGDELAVRDDDGAEIGGVLIVAPWDGPHVTLVIGLPTGFVDESPRVRRLLQRAYRQFMPRETNLILICASHPAECRDFERALLGSHVERWDAFPPRGRRIAHGRAGDGFWHANRHAESRVAGWFLLAPHEDAFRSQLWFRAGVPPDAALRQLMVSLFDACPPADADHAAG